uniref:Photosystem I reaction center subunit IX n=1 Tax=Polysiphonia sp. TaxID=1967842 RepID=A0A1Z1MT25_9FLOR|nr:photosystem I reaction center subunit IX [Polysiphonia sp.]
MSNNLMKYLSTVPVIGAIWVTFTAGFIIEINRFFPDILSFSF